MKIKKILAFLLAVFLILPAANLNVPAAVNNLTVNYSAAHLNFEAALRALEPAESNFHILTVTGAGALTDEDCAFIRSLNITSLNLTDSRFENDTVPKEAFKNQGIRSIALPLGTAVIGESAFEGCAGLFNIGMGSGLQEIGDRAFAHCAGLETIALTANISRIGAGAFQGAGLASIIAMRSDGYAYNAAASAFSGVSAQLVIPAGAGGYDSGAFAGLRTVEWIFHKLPEAVYSAAGNTVELSADVTDINNNPAEYQWFHNGRELRGMTGDTLVIINLAQADSGRYGVQVTIGGASVIFSATVEAIGSGGNTRYDTKDTAPVRTAAGPEKNKYDYAAVAAGGTVSEIKLELTGSIIRHTVPAGDSSYAVYAGKIRELALSSRNGYFEFNFANTGRFEVPFNILDNIRNIDLTRDYLLRISIKNGSAAQRGLTFALIEESGRVVRELDLTDSAVYMYYATGRTSENHIIKIEEAMYSYPVPSARNAQGMRKFRVLKHGALYTLAAPVQARFNDIRNHWGEREILNAASLSIVEGYPDGGYQPESVLTRAEFITMLARVIYHDRRESRSVRNFRDVQSADWFFENVQIAGRMGLLEFIADNRFRPEQAVTREEMAYMIAEAYSRLTGSADSSGVDYSDLSEVDPRYLTAVRICTNAGLLQGSSGRFMPKQSLTRAEAAAVLNRLFNLLANEI